MNPLEGLDPQELLSLSDASFQEKVKTRARALTAKAISTIEDVMDSSDDDQARLLAAGKILNVAKVEQEDLKALPTGISEEVFRIALAGLGSLARIAADANLSEHLLNVTPAKADPRPFIPDDSPLNAAPKEILNEEDLEDLNIGIEE